MTHAKNVRLYARACALVSAKLCVLTWRNTWAVHFGHAGRTLRVFVGHSHVGNIIRVVRHCFGRGNIVLGVEACPLVDNSDKLFSIIDNNCYI